MIPEWFIDLFTGVATWALSLLPKWDDNGIIVTASNWVTTLIAGAAGLGVWFPWGVLAVCMGLTSSWYGVIFLIKGVRWLVGWIPTMGGG